MLSSELLGSYVVHGKMPRRIFIKGRSTFVCFECRQYIKRHVGVMAWCAASREYLPEDPVPCPTCGRSCRWVSYKVEVPPHTDTRRWQKLLDRINESRQRHINEHRLRVTREKHELEQRINELLSRPANKDRGREIDRLRRMLDRLNDS